MAEKIKIIIVEDSLTMRNLLAWAFSEEPQFEVVSYASNGKLAIPRIKFYKPDFVILDYEMPMMDGLETIREIKKQNIKTSIIMFSAHTLEGAEITVQALKEGAIDFVPKPYLNNGTPENVITYIKQNLIQKILELHYGNQEIPQRHTAIEEYRHIQKKVIDIKNIDFLGIGISTGGPIVLYEILKKLPAIKKNIFIVQHMPPLFTTKLAESLDRIAKSKVVEAKDRQKVEKGYIYIAPGGYHMGLLEHEGQVYIRISDDPPINNCKPSVDYLFFDLAGFGPRAAGIIMTGIGNDGYEGIKKMYFSNCYTIAQSPESCTVFGMPKKPIEENLVYQVLTPDEIVEFIKKAMC